MVIGLGNPGKKYADTRHNVGYTVVKRVAEQWKVKFNQRRYSSKIAVGSKEGEKVMLILPHTYMNRSGQAVKQVMEGEKILPHRVVVIYDDLDLSLGTIRIRERGSAGSHKGMKSIVEETGSTEFPRIRVGIGPLPPQEEATSFVLSSFSKKEKTLLEKSLSQAEDALFYLLKGEAKKAMEVYNKRIDRQI